MRIVPLLSTLLNLPAPDLSRYDAVRGFIATPRPSSEPKRSGPSPIVGSGAVGWLMLQVYLGVLDTCS
jgi:hypothetical protein